MVDKKKRLVTISWTDEGAAQVLSFDASVAERHSLVSEVTDHPVESGANIADHIRPVPLELDLEGVISNTPLRTPPDNADGATEIEVKVEGRSPTVGDIVGSPIPVVGAVTRDIPSGLPPPTGFVKGFEPEFDRVKNAYDVFLLIRDRGLLVNVFTTLAEYENMAITAVNMPRSAATANILRFTMQLKEVRIGTTEEVPAPVIPTSQVNKGSQTPTPADPDPEEGDSTFLHNLLSP